MKITFLMSAVLIIGLLARPYMAVSNLLIVVLVLVITFVITSAKSVNLVTISEIGIRRNIWEQQSELYHL